MSLGPAGAAAGVVVVVVAGTVDVTVVTVVETTVEVVLIVGGVLTVETLVLVDAVATAGDSTLFRGRKTLVLTSVVAVLAAGSDSSIFSLSFSTVGVETSSFAGNGLFAAFGLASELGARISGLSLMFSLIGGKLPNVLLFWASGLDSDGKELVFGNSDFSALVFQRIREAATAGSPLVRELEKMLLSIDSFLIEALLAVGVFVVESGCLRTGGRIELSVAFNEGGSGNPVRHLRTQQTWHRSLNM